MDYIVCTKNDVEMLEDCINSIWQQENIHNLIVVCSKNSTDGTIDLCYDLSSRGLINVLLFEQKGITFAKAYGMRSADTDFMVLIDSDIVLRRNWINDMWKYMDDGVFAISGICYQNMRMKRYQERFSKVTEKKRRGMYADTIVRRDVVRKWRVPVGLNLFGDYSFTQHILEQGGVWLSVPVLTPHHKKHKSSHFRGSVHRIANARRAEYYRDCDEFIMETTKTFVGGILAGIRIMNPYFFTRAVKVATGSLLGYLFWKSFPEPRR